MQFGMYDYILLGSFVFLWGGMFFIGLERLVKILIGNYIYITIAISLRTLFQIIIIYLENTTSGFVKNPEQLKHFFLNNQSTIVFVIYILFIILVLLKSNLGIENNNSKFKRMLMVLILSPFVVISLFTTLLIVFYGMDMFILEKQLLLIEFFDNNYIKLILNYISLGYLLPGLLLVLLSLKISFPKFKFKLNLKKKKKNNNSDESFEESSQ